VPGKDVWMKRDEVGGWNELSSERDVVNDLRKLRLASVVWKDEGEDDVSTYVDEDAANRIIGHYSLNTIGRNTYGSTTIYERGSDKPNPHLFVRVVKGYAGRHKAILPKNAWGMRPEIEKLIRFDVKKKDLSFASADEALQHLANVTGKKVLVATEDMKTSAWTIKPISSPKRDERPWADLMARLEQVADSAREVLDKKGAQERGAKLLDALDEAVLALSKLEREDDERAEEKLELDVE